MDALYDVTATESEPLVDDSSNGLSDFSSRTAQSNTVAEVPLKDTTFDNSLSCAMQYYLLIKWIVRLKIPPTTHLTLIMKTQLPIKERIHPPMKQRTCNPMT